MGLSGSFSIFKDDFSELGSEGVLLFSTDWLFDGTDFDATDPFLDDKEFD